MTNTASIRICYEDEGGNLRPPAPVVATVAAIVFATCVHHLPITNTHWGEGSVLRLGGSRIVGLAIQSWVLGVACVTCHP